MLCELFALRPAHCVEREVVKVVMDKTHALIYVAVQKSLTAFHH